MAVSTGKEDLVYQYITAPEDLAACCEAIKDEPYIAVDTEFGRTDTYYPILSLIQVAARNIMFAVDLMQVRSIDPLIEILQNPACCKVFHSPRQDLEAIYQKFGIVVHNVFDTQIAMQLTGFQDPPSYEAMIRHYMHIMISKELQYSDWLKRPLSEEQLKYAILDVKYLYQVYPKIIKELENANKLSWALEENEIISSPTHFIPNLEASLHKYTVNIKELKHLHLSYELLKWREQRAKMLNVPKNNILTDAIIKSIATGEYGIQRLRKSLSKKVSDILEEIEQLITQTKKNPIPDFILEAASHSPMAKNDCFEIIKVMLRSCATKYAVSEKLLASQEEILKFCYNRNSKLCYGWRYNIFGQEAALVRDGNAAIAFVNQKLQIMQSSHMPKP